MRFRILLSLFILRAVATAAPNPAFPLESVVIEGAAMPSRTVVEISGLRVGEPVEKSRIEQACRKLQDTGLFSSIYYRYAPGAKKGYVVTLTVADQQPMSPAEIDIPGIDDDEVWTWVKARFGPLDHRVPQVDEAHAFLAGEIERYLGARLRGQYLTVRMETDLKTRKTTMAFQPERLPRIVAVVFSGNTAVSSGELASALHQVVAGEGYTPRQFAGAVELNLRPVYEQHGFYRAAFAPKPPQWSEAGVSLEVAIIEGAPYQLGKVELLGDDLPRDGMYKAAKFPLGKLANWRQIQEGLWELEKVVKRTGYFEAVARPERVYDDANHVVDLRVRTTKGPLYRFGELRIAGLPPEVERTARQMWKPKPGDPYDYAYPNEFLQAFWLAVNGRDLNNPRVKAEPAGGDHVMDINLIFGR